MIVKQNLKWNYKRKIKRKRKKVEKQRKLISILNNGWMTWLILVEHNLMETDQDTKHKESQTSQNREEKGKEIDDMCTYFIKNV